MVDATERLQVLLLQEATIYRTSDYLTRILKDAAIEASLGASSVSDDCGSCPESPSKKRKSQDSSAQSDVAQTNPHYNTKSDESSYSGINTHWREKICEWAYQGKFLG